MMYVLAIALLLTAWKYAADIRRYGIRAVVLNTIAALGAGLLAGILLGVSARIAMRLLALGIGTPLRLTSAGTFTVVAVFSGLGIVLSLPYSLLLRDFLRRNSLAYAILLTLVTLQPFIRTAAQDLGADVWETRVIGGAVMVTIVMWGPYAILLEASFSRLSRLFRADNLSQPSIPYDAT